MKNDFPAAADFWSEGVEIATSQKTAETIRQLAAEGFLQAHEPMKAWEVCKDCLQPSTFSAPNDNEALLHPIDTSLWIASSRWFQRKLNQILEASSSEKIELTIDEDEKNEFQKAISVQAPSDRHVALELFIDRFAGRKLEATAMSSLRTTLQKELSDLTGMCRVKTYSYNSNFLPGQQPAATAFTR